MRAGAAMFDWEAGSFFVGDSERVRCCLDVPIIVRRRPQRLVLSSSCSELDVELLDMGRGRKTADCGDVIPSKVNDDNPRAVEMSGSVRTIIK